MKCLGATAVLFLFSGVWLDGQSPPFPDNDSVKRAQALVEKHQLQKANDLLTSVVSNDGSNLRALTELGEVQLAQGLTDGAMKSFEAVLAQRPQDKPAQSGEAKAGIEAALAARRAGDNAGALVYLVRAKRVAPNDVTLLVDFGIQADSMRIYKDADETLSHARELAPDDANVLYALAHVELDEQKMPDAEANLRKYLTLRPRDASAYYGLGHLLHMLVRNDEAKAELRKSIELQPNQTESYYELGQIALELHVDAAAKAQFEKVLAAAPKHGGALTGMGVLAYRAKDNDAAEKYLSAAVLQVPDYPIAHRYYAMLLARTGRQVEADQESALANSMTEREARQSKGYFLTPVQ